MAGPGQDSKELPEQQQRVGVREFRGNLTGFLRQARHGQSFLITSHDQVLAEIRPPPAAARPRRRPGALRGRIRMAPDFDALPPEVLAAMEGGEEG
jgi:antitoxin (DNA-binding transcriptional repressor) of toxin-antitoxin stability system